MLYKTTENDITKTLALVWGIDIFKGNYKDDYCRINYTLARQWTAWCDKYQTTLWREDDNWSGRTNCSGSVLQPIPDNVRWVKTKVLHYLTLERNSGIVSTVSGRFTTMPGHFLPSRLLENFYKINPSPTDDVLSDIALLVWIQADEVKRYFKEANEQDTDSYEQNKLRDKWKTTDLYKTNSCGELRDKCKKVGLPTVGVKHQLVQRVYDSNIKKVPPDNFKSNYNGNLDNLPASLKGLRNLSIAQIE